MSSRSRAHQQRLGAHSRSTPNFATIKEELPPLPSWGTSPRSKQSRNTPASKRKSPTFTPGAPSEPVSADDKDDDDDSSSAHSGSSFERDLLSRTTSYSESAYSSDEEAEDAASGAPSSRRISPHRSTASGTTTPGLRPIYMRSQSALGPSTFAPPFYGRPPTPLPPSPSLTSLLRPRPFTNAFSPSRPTTPDSSDTEATGATSAFSGVRNTYSTTSLARASTINSATPSTVGLAAQSAVTSPVPSASPRLPTKEYYGFVLYLGSSIAFFIYLLWSYLPTPFLHQLGIYYYPDRWWSLAVPSWLVMALVWTYVALASYNTGYLTLPLKSLECLVDEKGRLAVVDSRGKIIRERKGGRDVGQGRAAGKQRRKREKREKEKRREREMGEQQMREMDLDWRSLWSEGTDAVMDVPIGGVCEVLYGAGGDALPGEDINGGEGNENG